MCHVRLREDLMHRSGFSHHDTSLSSETPGKREIPRASLWLCSDEAAYIIGKEIAIGGGQGIKP